MSRLGNKLYDAHRELQKTMQIFSTKPEEKESTIGTNKTTLRRTVLMPDETSARRMHDDDEFAILIHALDNFKRKLER